MKRFLLLLLALFFVVTAGAQKKVFIRQGVLQRKNNFFLNLGGNGLFLSLNYDRILLVKPGYFVDISTGIGVFPGIAGANIPHQVVLNKGKGTSFFMIGLGGTYEWHKTDESGFTESVNSYNLVPIIGWKKFFKKHLLFSIYASPLIHIYGTYLLESLPVIPYGGVSLGYSF